MSFKQDNTSKIVEKCIAAIDANAPINISFITQPMSKAFVDRIESLEKVYSQSKFYQFLIKKGVYPALLFSIVSGCVGCGVYRTYHRSTKLVLNLLGVVYPTYCCWHLVKNQLNGQDEKLKSWLTYWMLFGSFQVLDHWIALDLFMISKRKYSLYKLLILYWAQSPHSKGALLLYRHVIQKPIMKSLNREDQKEEQQVQQHVESYQTLDYHLTGSSIAHSVEHKSDDNDSSSTSSSTSSSSSSDDDSVGLKYRQHEDHHSINHSLSTEKEVFPPLLMNGTEAAW